MQKSWSFALSLSLSLSKSVDAIGLSLRLEIKQSSFLGGDELDGEKNKQWTDVD